MFEIGMNEATENQMNIADDFSFAVVEAAVFLCYDRQIPTVFNLDDKMKLLQFLDMYQIAHLKVCLLDILTVFIFMHVFQTRIETYLIENVSVSTVCKLVNCSIDTNASKLKKHCADFILTCMESKTSLADIESLDVDFALKVFNRAFFKVTET